MNIIQKFNSLKDIGLYDRNKSSIGPLLHVNLIFAAGGHLSNEGSVSFP